MLKGLNERTLCVGNLESEVLANLTDRKLFAYFYLLLERVLAKNIRMIK